MAAANGQRRGMIVSVFLVLAIAFGSLGGTLAANWSPKLGLDLAGGLSVIFKPAHHTSTSNLALATQILADRVDGLGVNGAETYLAGDNINVSVPGVKDGRHVLAVIGQVGQVYFRPVLCLAYPYIKTKVSAKGGKASVGLGPLPSCTGSYLMNSANMDVTPDTNVTQGYIYNTKCCQLDPAFAPYPNTNPNEKNYKSSDVLLPLLGGGRALLGPVQLSGQSVKGATLGQTATGGWAVNYTLTSAGSPLWDQVAEANFHTEVAIELDGVIQSNPIIQPSQSSFTSFAGQGEISGSFTQSQAKSLVLVLQYGSLPVKLDRLTVEVVSPTLGHSALIAGLGAGLVGLILVLLYMVLYYRALGLVIMLGLGATGALLWAIISALGHTSVAPSFDLAGVTGLIVSIGITVDSYIVYFERLKDETRAGRTVRTSVDRGFKSAWKTVLAADFVSLLAAVLLYLIAVASVRGFAFFLGLSTLLDVFVTWYFTRPLVMLLGRREGAGHSMVSIAAGLQVRTNDEVAPSE